MTPGSEATSLTLESVQAAALRIRGQVERTPFLLSQTLSELAGAEIWLKFENLQYTASFKERGALNKLLQLDQARCAAGVVAMSAGNHAQGVAHHARRLGIPATIVMPAATAFIKVENTRRLGAEVVLAGAGVEEAATEARQIAGRSGATFVHPFDDPAIIAGQGTTALEMIEDGPALDAILVPIGGGGLISGMAIAAKALRPEIEILGVETAGFPSMKAAAGQCAPGEGGPTIADGIAVKAPGGLTLPIVRRLVSDILLVQESDIEAAVLRLLEIEKTVVEGAGAVGLAAVLGAPGRFAGRRLGIVLSGGNIDMRLLSAVIIRGLVRSERLVRLRVGLPDSPGSLASLAQVIAQGGGNVVDVVHQRAFSRRGVKEADVDLTIETRNADHARQLNAAVHEAGFSVEVLNQ
jgi:threonine dehydratase